MNLPEELNSIIISFIYSEPQLNLVCKEFNDNVSVFKKAAKVISLWYYKKRHIKDNMYNNTNNLIRHYVLNYPKQFLLSYPEFTVSKLRLSKDMLNKLQPLVNRKRSEVINWMKEQDISLTEWFYVGW
jgi:hypothetical protein